MIGPYEVDVPDFIPSGIPLPAAVIAADKARDEAYDAYSEKLLEYADVLDDEDAVKRAAQRDYAAARQAVLDGIDPDTIPSEVDRVRRLQPRAKGIVQGLADKVRAADNAVFRAWAAALPETAEQVDRLRAEAEAEMKATEVAYRSALGRFRYLVQTTAYVRLQRAGRARTLVDSPRFSMSPRLDETHSELARHWLTAHGVPDSEQEA